MSINAAPSGNNNYSFQNNAYLSVSEAAKLLETSASTLRRLESEGKINSQRDKNNYRLYALGDVLALKEELRPSKAQEKPQKQKQSDDLLIATVPVSHQLEKVAKNNPYKMTALLGSRSARTIAFSIAGLCMLFAGYVVFGNVLPSSNTEDSPTIAQKIKSTFEGQVLAEGDENRNYIFNINIPSVFRQPVRFIEEILAENNVAIEEDLSVSGLSQLIGGIETPTLTFTEFGTINQLDGIDEVTETTLENALDLQGDIVSTGLNNTSLALNSVDDDELVDILNYTGTLNLAGDFEIGGTQVDATADELNILSGALVTTQEINYLSGLTVTGGGVIFGDGNSFAQDTGNFVWDDVNNRLGLGTNTPTATFSVGPNSEFQIDATGSILAADDVTASGSITFNSLATDGVVTVSSGLLGSKSEGSGGGLDADLLDGLTSSQFLRSDISDSFTSGTLSFVDGTFLDLSQIAQDDSSLQGIRLPQSTALANPASGEGFLAYDTDDDELQVFDGTSWVPIGQGFFTDGGAVTYLTSQTDDLALGGIDSTAPFFFDEGLEKLSVENLQINSLDCTGAGNGGALTTDASGNVVCSADDGGAGSTQWTLTGSVVHLNTSTNNVTVGSTTNLAKFAIDGDADEVQFLVQGNATQTTNLMVLEQSDGTDVFTVNNAGNTDVAGTLTTGTANAFAVDNSGNVTAGTWTADAIAAQYGGTGDDTSATTGVPYISSGNWLYESQLSVARGGTGAGSLTDGGILLGSGTGAITATAQPTNGQLLIGSNGVDPVLGTLSEGEGIDITNGAGSITILGEDATIANKGIASFNDSYFSVSSGAVSIDDIYLFNTGDVATGDYDYTGADILGASPLVFEGTTNDGTNKTTFAITDPTAPRTITFKNESGTVAYISDITASGHDPVTLAGSLDYLTLSGQEITLNTIDVSDDTNLVAGTNITLSGDTLNVDDVFLLNTGDVATGDYDYTGADILGASPLVFEGTTNDGTNKTTFAITDPTAPRTITFKNESGTVAYISDITASGHDPVTLAGSLDYLTLSGQQITLNTVDVSDDTNLLAGTNITLSGDTLNVDDAFLLNTGDTGIGDYNFTGAILMGASPLVFEGASDNAFQTTLAFTDPTNPNTITFQDATGTVAFLSDIAASNYVSWSIADDDTDTYAVVSGNIVRFTSSDGNVLTNLLNGDDGDENLDFSIRRDGDIIAGAGLTGDVSNILVGSDSDDVTLAIGAGTGITVNANDIAATLGTDIVTGEIVDDTILEADLNLTTHATSGEDNYLLSYDDATGGFTWVAPSSVQLTEDDVEGYIYDTDNDGGAWSYTATSNGIDILTLERATDTAPTGNFLDLENAAGTSLFTIDITGTLTTGTLALDSLSYTGTLDQAYGGTGINTSAVTNGQLLIGNSTGNVFNLATLTAGNAIDITNGAGSITIDHEDTSSQASVNNSGTTFIQDVTLDSFGHITGLTSVDLGSSFDNYGSWTIGDDDADTYTIASSNILRFTSSDGNVLTNLVNGDDGDENLDLAIRRLGDVVAGGGLTGDVSNILVGSDSDDVTLAIGAGTGITVNANDIEATLGTDIVTSEIVDDTILEIDLDVTNAPVDDYVLSYDQGTGGFTWVINDGGSGASKWTDAGTVTYLTADTDDLALGVSSETLVAPFSVDVSGNLVRLGDGANDANDPTIAFYASDATDNGTLSFSDDDEFVFTGGDVNFGSGVLGAGLSSCNASGDKLLWNSTTNQFECGTDSGSGSGSSPFGTSGGVITKVTPGDYLSLRYGDAADTQLIIENTTSGTIPTVDAASIDITGGTTGVVTDGIDLLSIAGEFGNGTANTNSLLHLDLNPVNTPSGDEVFYAINIDGLTGTSANETAINIGAGWDNVFNFAGTEISAAEINILDGGITLSSETSGDYVASFTAGGGLTGDASGHGSAPTLAIGAGTGITVNANDIAATLGTDIVTGEIVDDTILEADLNLTTHATSGEDNYLLSYDDATGGFTWVAPSSIQLTEDDVEAYIYDTDNDGGAWSYTATSNGIDILTLERATDTAPTGNFLDLENAAGTSLFTIDITGTLTAGTLALDSLSYTGTLDPVNGGTGDDTSATTGVPYISSGNWLYESQLSVARGGTGAGSLTDGGILLGSGTGAITATAQPTNGQLLIGSTGGDPVLGTLTAGNAIDVTNGAGSITIDHEDTSSQASVNNSGTTFIQDVTLDTYGHITGLTSVDLSGSFDNYGSWSIDGDDADTQAISSGNTLLIAGGTNGIDTDVSGVADTITLNLDTTEIGTTTFGSGSGFTWTFDAGATDPVISFASDQINLGSATTGIQLNAAGALLDIDGNLVLNDQVDIGSATTGIRVATTGSVLDIDGNIILGDTVDIGSATTGINVTTAGAISDIDGDVTINDNGVITGILSVQGNSIGLNNDADTDNIFSFNSASAGSASGDLYWGDDLVCDVSETNCGWTTTASSFSNWTIADDDADTYAVASGNIVRFTSSDGNVLTNLLNGDDGDENLDFSIRRDGDIIAGAGLTGDVSNILVGSDSDDVTLAIGAGTGITVNANDIAATLGTDIVTGEIVDDTILEADLNLTTHATSGEDNYLLSYDDATGGFTWVAPSSIQLTEDDVEAYIYDTDNDGGAWSYTATSNGIDILTLERATDTAPTGNFLDLENAAGTSLFTIDITGTLTAGTLALDSLSYTGTLDPVNGGTGDDTSATTGVPYISSGNWLYESQLSVARGGTGAGSLTDGGILLGSGTGAITATAQPTNGQLLIGSTGGDPVLGTLTAGNAIDVTNGAGSITIDHEDTSSQATVNNSGTTFIQDVTLDTYGHITGLTSVDLSGSFDNYGSWTFAVDGISQDPITTGDVLDFVSGSNVTVTRSADDQITIAATDNDTTYSAGNDLDLSGTTFNIESTLDFVDTINLTGTGTLNGLDAVDATTENTIESLIFDADAESISGVWTVADNTNFRIGTGGDLTFAHNGTDTTITSSTGILTIDNTNATGSTYLRMGSDTGATEFLILNNSDSTLLGIDGAGHFSLSTGVWADRILDEDNFASNSPNALATQQSIKAYVDDQFNNGYNLWSIYDGTTTEDLESDDILTIADSSTINGTVTATDILTYNVIADSLNFTELSDSLTLDAATTITNGLAGNIIINLSSTGDMLIQDNGGAFVSFLDTGVFTLDSLNFDGTTIGLTSDTDLLSLANNALTVNGTGLFTGVLSTNATSIGLNNDADADNVLSFGAAGGQASGSLYWGDDLLCDPSLTNCGWSTGGTGFWEDGTNGIFEDDEAVIIGADSAFTNFSGGVGDLRVADQLEVIGSSYFDGAIDLDSTLDIDANSATALTIGDGTNNFFTLDATADAADTLLTLDDVTDTISSGTIFALTGDGITTGNALSLSADALTTGNGLYLESTSAGLTSGSLVDLYWNPGSAATATGDIFSLNIGSNATLSGRLFALYDNGSDVFNVGTSLITSAVPHAFTAGGDVSFAYDAVFTNQTTSAIQSYGPLTIESGESFENNDLTLRPFGTGSVVIDSSGLELYTGENLVLDTDDSGDSYFEHVNASNRIALYLDGNEEVRFNYTNGSGNSIEADQTISAGSDFDLAETYPTFDDQLEAGHVVMVDLDENVDDRSALVKRADALHRDLIVGVVSTSPGITLGAGSFTEEFCFDVREKGVDAVISEYRSELEKEQEITTTVKEATIDQKVVAKREVANSCLTPTRALVTLAGRIPVKVDLANGDIKPGDALTIGTEIGRATKATSAGMIVGRALEPFTQADIDAGKDSVLAILQVNWWQPNSNTTFENLNSSVASDIDLKNVGDLKVTKNFEVLGRSNLGDTSILGDLRIGTTKISDGHINTLASTLYLQDSYAAGNVDFFNGRIVMTTDGSIKTMAVLDAKEVKAEEFTVKSNATVGTGVLNSGQTKVVIPNNQVQANSKVFITPRTLTDKTLVVTSISNGNSFTVEVASPSSSNIAFDYWIVGVE